MIKLVVRSGIAAAVAAAAASLSVAAPASAAQVPCGNPGNAKVYLQSMGKVPLCFTGLGSNSFNKVGVYLVESGQWTVTVRQRGNAVTVKPGQSRTFAEPINPQYIDLAPGAPRT